MSHGVPYGLNSNWQVPIKTRRFLNPDSGVDDAEVAVPVTIFGLLGCAAIPSAFDLWEFPRRVCPTYRILPKSGF